MNLPLHGSNPSYLYQAFGLDMPNEILDFSVNINPYGPPAILKEKWADWFELIEDYPDPNGVALTECIAEQEMINPASILLGNGGAELITLLASYFSGKRIGIIQPTFSEYEKVAKAYGCDVINIDLIGNHWQLDMATISRELADLDALFICHPNNPTGTTHPTPDLLTILKLCEQHACYVIIDEAFHDFLKDNQSLAHVINESDYLIILRSMTKMYTMAGLRLGFLMGPPALVSELEKLKPHWSVNALALEAGKEVLHDKKFVEATTAWIDEERHQVLTQLEQLGYVITKSQVNFYLLRDPSLANQRPLIKFLLRQGLVPRHTENFPGLNGRWLRLAIRKEDDNHMLMEALRRWKQAD